MKKTTKKEEARHPEAAETPCECSSGCAAHCNCGGSCGCHGEHEGCTCEATEAESTTEAEIVESAPDDDKYAEMLNRYQRCLAEFDNYRKRTAKEMAARYGDGIRAACEKLLPIVDNFERALAAHNDPESTFHQGIALIARQFGGVLEEMGVKPIETQPGDPFDANLHHAVAHTEDENLGQNEIAAVLQKGYVHKERVLRYAMVKVAN
ncbi:MAG: nucleotide exchange factor GrpE [Defluviitaleaceae bacterium]|nr:nucleotide exchange factor GrpE [Defluviitaleaceae bacterium]